MELQVVGKKTAKVNVSDNVFARDFNEALIHQVIVAYQAAGRQGTKAQKTRSEVRGGGRKPWRQKGTGNARAGSIRSPLWIGGGRTFAAKPRDFSQKVNRKMYQGAMASILSELVRHSTLVVVDQVALSEPKTKAFIQLLDSWKAEGQVLIVVNEVAQELTLASRNVYRAKVVTPAQLSPVDLVHAGTVVMTEAALKQIEGSLQ
ncbi:MAG TPA: 50S ribosomal protein L4 [Coxiellaceae bacterium]|nr:50S ribosomal protein L4 [Coxiellaceae bacterium]